MRLKWNPNFSSNFSDATVMDAVDPQNGGNGGLLQRWSFTGAGGVIAMEGPLQVDICQQ